MRLLFLTTLLIISTLYACATVKTKPEHNGVATEIAKFDNEFKTLAKEKGILINKRVSMGFKPLENWVIGTCNYGGYFREIDIDPNYWSISTDLEKKILIFHELGHCYCNRPHDFHGQNYEENYLKQFKRWVLNEPEETIGMYADHCPISIMYPFELDKTCFLRHYNEYIDELFEGCSP